MLMKRVVGGVVAEIIDERTRAAVFQRGVVVVALEYGVLRGVLEYGLDAFRRIHVPAVAHAHQQAQIERVGELPPFGHVAVVEQVALGVYGRGLRVKRVGPFEVHQQRVVDDFLIVEFRLHDVFVDAFERLLEGHVAEQVGHVRNGQGYGLRVGILLLLRELIHLYGIDGPASAEVPRALEFAVGEHEAVQLIQRAGLHRILHELVVVAPRAVFHASGALENQVFEHLGGVGLADLRPVGVLVVIVEIYMN